MNRNNLSTIFENSKSHINKSIYKYLFVLMKYIFLGPNNFKNQEKIEEITEKLTLFTNKINKEIIKNEEQFIKFANLKESYNMKNFHNIIKFVKLQSYMFAGDIIEGILIFIFNYSFELTDDGDFGKYLYNNITRLREPSSNTNFSDWFKKSKLIFMPEELKDIGYLVKNDPYIKEQAYDIISTPILHQLLYEIMKLKFNFLIVNSSKRKSIEYIYRGQLDLINFEINVYKSLKNMINSNSITEKEFSNNSIGHIFYCYFREKKPPIKMIRNFLISTYIYNQNEHYSSIYEENDDKLEEESVDVPFTYQLGGAMIEGRFGNTIISPIKIEPRLKKINFEQNLLREEGLFELGKALTFNQNKNNKSDKSINLKLCLLKGYFFDFFISGFGLFDNYDVEELNISNNSINEDSHHSVSAILKHCKGLKTLNFSYNRIKSCFKFFFILLKKLYRQGKTNLENLYLNECYLDSSSLYELGELLKSKFCKLKRLGLGINEKSNIINFLKKIKLNRSLIELSLIKNNLENEDIDDICRIISSTNIKQLILHKNKFNNDLKISRMISRTKLIKKKNEFTNESNIDFSSSLMHLDLSNNEMISIMKEFILFLNNVIQDNSTFSCLDFSHVLLGQTPDKMINDYSRKGSEYHNALKEILLKTIEERKKKFDDLLIDKFNAETAIKIYEKKKKKINIEEFLGEKINDIKNNIITNEKAKYPALLREKSINIIDSIKMIGDKDSDEYNDLVINIVEYMRYEKAKKRFDEINHMLNFKNLIII